MGRWSVIDLVVDVVGWGGEVAGWHHYRHGDGRPGQAREEDPTGSGVRLDGWGGGGTVGGWEVAVVVGEPRGRSGVRLGRWGGGGTVGGWEVVVVVGEARGGGRPLRGRGGRTRWWRPHQSWWRSDPAGSGTCPRRRRGRGDKAREEAA